MRNTQFSILLVLALAISEISANCYNGSCNTSCRQQGYSSGICQGLYCVCRRSMINADEAVEEVVAPVEPVDPVAVLEPEVAVDNEVKPEPFANCYNGSCNSSCRQQGYSSGICQGLYCVCRRSMINAEVAVDPAKVDDNEVKPEPRYNCIEFFCNSQCLAWGHQSGFCENEWTCTCRG